MMNLFIIISVILFLCDTGYAEDCTLSDKPPKPNSGCCGRAVDGSKSSESTTRIGEYPWMASVEYQMNKGKIIKLLCGAVLISRKYVLSAANCFSETAFKIGRPVNIRLGEYDINHEGPDCVKTESGGQDCTEGAISIPIDKFTIHPEYNMNKNRQNDIVLIKLARTAPYTDFIRPICLPTLDITLKAPKNLFMTVAGWGAVNTTVSRSNVLRRVHVPYVDFYLCRHTYNSTRFSHIQLSNGQLCAGSKNRDSCQGDSGGPLMLLKGQTTELAGIVSFGPNPCGQGIPGVYTRVFTYNEWIKTTIETYDQESTKPTEALVTTKTTTEKYFSDIIVFRE